MKTLNVALAGNPNSGKTTLFNLLAGTNYHVANYPGITVDKKFACVKHKENCITFHDLPGTYSLTAYSMEEKVARDFIINDKPDLIVHVVDASNLLRNLYLTIQLMELGVPVIIALNMMDIAEKRNRIIDCDLLSQNFKAPVVKLVARTGKGREQLLNTIVDFDFANPRLSIADFSYGSDIDNYIIDLQKLIPTEDQTHMKWLYLKYLENDQDIIERHRHQAFHPQVLEHVVALEKHINSTMKTYPEGIIADYRYGIVSHLMDGVVTNKNTVERVHFSDEVDKIITHRIIGPLLLLFILYAVYCFTFWASEYPTGWLEAAFSLLSNFVDTHLPDGLIKSMITSGIIDGVGGVLGFTPLIFFMFFVISILEDSGYMARMAYMLDRVFKWFGLQGNSVVPFIVSGGIAGGCAVPGVMAARTIKGNKERLLTILTAPFMACGAKIPIFALLVSAFFPGDKAIMLLCITLVSWCFALLAAKLYSKTIIRGPRSSFIMELPPYRIPTIKGLLLHAWERTWMYIKKAGTVILAISIILWAFMTFPQLPQHINQQYDQQIAKVNGETEAINRIENERSKQALQHSVAGRVGQFLEPVSQLAGFDWKVNIALLGGVAAKEVVVSTLGISYSLGEIDAEESLPLAEKLKNDPHWSIGTALAMILFVILYAPCFVTVIAIVKETGKYRWGFFSIFGNSLIAFIIAATAYQIWS